MVCASVRTINHSLKLMGYQMHKQYNNLRIMSHPPIHSVARIQLEKEQEKL